MSRSHTRRKGDLKRKRPRYSSVYDMVKALGGKKLADKVKGE